MKTPLRVVVFALAMTMLGCGDDDGAPVDASTPIDASPGSDAGMRVDAGGEPEDGGAPEDAGSDAGEIADSGIDASTTPDAGPADAGTPARILVIGDLRSGSAREFPATSFRALLARRGTVTEEADVTLTAAVLGAYDLVVFGDQANDLTTSERTVLRFWTGGEGRALALAGYSADGQARANTVAQALTPELSVMLDPALGNGETARYADPDARLPLSLATPNVVGGYRLSVTASPLVAEEVRATLGGELVGVSFATTNGRAFFWADEYASLDAGWSASTEAFWEAVLDYLLEGI